MIDPVIKDIFVPVPPARAFDIFTRELAAWWPVATHSLSAADGKLPLSVTVEPRTGGAIIETMHDGTRANWGRISTWEPGARLGFSWHLRRPEAQQTQVEISFRADAGGTRLRLVHSGWDAQAGDGAANREQYNAGWDHVLSECYAALAAA